MCVFAIGGWFYYVGRFFLGRYFTLARNFFEETILLVMSSRVSKF